MLSTVPFWFVRTPPLVDFLAHIGRYHVELHLADSPALQQNWDFHWQLVGNLGVELLIAALAPMLGLERAAWLIALALPLLMISAIGRVSRALHGELTPFAIAAAWFAMSYPFQLGFVNYWLGCALAFHVFASWVETTGGMARCCARRCSRQPPAWSGSLTPMAGSFWSSSSALSSSAAAGIARRQRGLPWCSSSCDAPGPS
ncbi:hypothetical protein [Bradyrhizobium sp. RDM12]